VAGGPVPQADAGLGLPLDQAGLQLLRDVHDEPARPGRDPDRGVRRHAGDAARGDRGGRVLPAGLGRGPDLRRGGRQPDHAGQPAVVGRPGQVRRPGVQGHGPDRRAPVLDVARPVGQPPGPAVLPGSVRPGDERGAMLRVAGRADRRHRQAGRVVRRDGRAPRVARGRVPAAAGVPADGAPAGPVRSRIPRALAAGGGARGAGLARAGAVPLGAQPRDRRRLGLPGAG
jgi:hypothetical protein